MMRFTALPALMGILLSICFSLGCRSTPAVPEPIADGRYVVASINGKPFTPAREVTVTIGEGRIAGDGPVNRWSGALTDGTIGMMLSTKMAGPPEQMKLEDELFSVLEDATLKASDGKLIVIKGGQSVATLEPR